MTPLIMSAAIGAIATATVLLSAIVFRKHSACWECGIRLPKLRAPTSLRQALWGGFTCQNCGTELDASGQKIRSVPFRSN